MPIITNITTNKTCNDKTNFEAVNSLFYGTQTICEYSDDQYSIGSCGKYSTGTTQYGMDQRELKYIETNQ